MTASLPSEWRIPSVGQCRATAASRRAMRRSTCPFRSSASLVDAAGDVDVAVAEDATADAMALPHLVADGREDLQVVCLGPRVEGIAKRLNNEGAVRFRQRSDLRATADPHDQEPSRRAR